MSVFVPGEFTSHSGIRLPFRVECDDHTDEEVRLFASLMLRMWRDVRIGVIVPVPKGRPDGVDNAFRLYPHLYDLIRPIPPKPRTILVVDDVWTTGRSMWEVVSTIDERTTVVGAVIYARGPTPPWVRAVLTLEPSLW